MTDDVRDLARGIAAERHLLDGSLEPGDGCSRCHRYPCECTTAAPQQRIVFYTKNCEERIADALERIADALEQTAGYRR
jgi:hypothetical protein